MRHFASISYSLTSQLTIAKQALPFASPFTCRAFDLYVLLVASSSLKGIVGLFLESSGQLQTPFMEKQWLRSEKWRPIYIRRHFCKHRYMLDKLGNVFGNMRRISGWVCAAGTVEPLTYTRLSSAEFCYRILE